MKITLSEMMFNEKPQGDVISLVNKSLHQKEVSVEELADAIKNGCTFCPAVFKNDMRNSENFISASMIALDIDKSSIPMEEAAKDFSCTISYPTFSNGTEEKYSYRFIVRLDSDITSLDEYCQYATILSELLKEKSGVSVDETCIQGSRMFFGTNGDVVTTLSEYDYDKQFLLSWWQEHDNIKIIYKQPIKKETGCCTHSEIYTLLQRGVSDRDIMSTGYELGYEFVTSNRQIINWLENEEVRIEYSVLEIKRKWKKDKEGKNRIIKWGIGEDRRMKMLKILSIKKQIKPSMQYDELLFNAICERYLFFDNSDNKLNNQWILSIIPVALNNSRLFETKNKYTCNMPLLRANGKSYQKAIAENKHQGLVKAVTTLYNPSFTILQNLESMKEKGLKISLRSLKNILREQGLTKKGKKIKQDASTLLKE